MNYEYMTVDRFDELQKFGQLGWKLVTVYRGVCYLMREVAA